MKMIGFIILALTLTASASAQLIHDSVRVKVAPGVTCPSGWTASSSTVVVEEKFYIHIPDILGGGFFLVSEDLVDSLWPGDAERAAAIVAGILEHQAEVSSTQNFCSLLPTTR